MKWFGKAGGAPYEDDSPHVATPVGQACGWCDEPFAPGDDGVLLPLLVGEDGACEIAYHYECHLRQVIGGLNHLRGNCSCCGGDEHPDPPWLSKRQAAVQAVSVWQRSQA